MGVHVLGGERGPFSRLVDWQGLEGWEKGPKTLGTATAKIFGDAGGKVAIIAEKQFAGEQARRADVFRQATLRFFRTEQREAALAWLRGQ